MNLLQHMMDEAKRDGCSGLKMKANDVTLLFGPFAKFVVEEINNEDLIETPTSMPIVFSSQKV